MKHKYETCSSHCTLIVISCVILQEFIAAEPFDHLFGVLINAAYLPAMRKKKGADSTGDTASSLGVAMDELMRHQPTLRVSVITALIRVRAWSTWIDGCRVEWIFN